MNSIASFLVFACVVAAVAAGYFVSPYLAFAFLAAGVLIAMSLDVFEANGALKAAERPRPPVAAACRQHLPSASAAD